MTGQSPIVRYGRYGALAFEFTGTIAGGAFSGWLLDSWLGSDPWGVVTLTLLGVVGGFIRLVQMVRRFDRETSP